MATAMSGIRIDHLYGNCPVQADGEIDGVPFYFRARGEHWRIEIGPGNTNLIIESPDPASVEALGCWEYSEPWPGGLFEAGWMSESDARACIQKGANAWRLRDRK